MKRLLVAALAWIGVHLASAQDASFDKHIPECRVKLNIIHEAIQAFRRQHSGALPRSLSELCPDYIHDPTVLYCPSAQASGVYTPGFRDVWTNLRNEFVGSYNWEFSNERVPEQYVPSGDVVTWHDIKTALTRSPIGEKVPTVRCETFRNHALNLGYGGEVYASPLYWEELFVDRFPHPYSEPELILRDQRPIRDRLPPPAQDSVPGAVDLSTAYNACLADPWLTGRGVDRIGLPADSATVLRAGAVSFAVRGIVQVQGAVRPNRTAQGFSARAYPPTSMNVSVRASAAQVHLLHATAFPAPPGEMVGAYELRTRSGKLINLPLRMDSEISYWRSANAPLETPWRDRDSSGECMVFHYVWHNPAPEDEIESIRLQASPQSVASPFLLAITINSTRR